MFRYSICDPLKQDPIEMGEIEKEKIPEILERFPWTDLLHKMKNAPQDKIYFSPSLEVENKSNRHGLAISAVENDKDFEFYIFYKRPKMVSKFFGLFKSMDENFNSDRTGQTSKDVQEAVAALLANDLSILEQRWG